MNRRELLKASALTGIFAPFVKYFKPEKAEVWSIPVDGPLMVGPVNIMDSELQAFGGTYEEQLAGLIDFLSDEVRQDTPVKFLWETTRITGLRCGNITQVVGRSA